MLKTLVILAALGLALASGCIDEDKTGCQTDGDCQGVRVCREGACQTPEGFDDEILLGDPSAPGEVLGDACAAPQTGFRFTVEIAGVEPQALALGLTGRVIEPLPEDPEASVTVAFEGGPSARIVYTRPLDPEAGPLLGVEVGAEVRVRYVEGGVGLDARLLELHRVDDNTLILAACDGDNDRLPCQGQGWRFVRGEGSDCDPIEAACGPGVRFPLDLNSPGIPGDPLYAGQRQLVTAVDGGGFVRLVGEAIGFDAPCPDGGAGEVNAVLFRQR